MNAHGGMQVRARENQSIDCLIGERSGGSAQRSEGIKSGVGLLDGFVLCVVITTCQSPEVKALCIAAPHQVQDDCCHECAC